MHTVLQITEPTKTPTNRINKTTTRSAGHHNPWPVSWSAKISYQLTNKTRAQSADQQNTESHKTIQSINAKATLTYRVFNQKIRHVSCADCIICSHLRFLIWLSRCAEAADVSDGRSLCSCTSVSVSLVLRYKLWGQCSTEIRISIKLTRQQFRWRQWSQ